MQRDLLPLVEGSTVSTKYGSVKTDHILFIASGAFHLAKPSDLIPELQGRFPIRVELGALSKDDFVRILTEPKAALTTQYVELLKTEGVTLEFTDDAVDRLAEIAAQVNERQENIGARRLHTVLERLLDTLSFEAPGPRRPGVTHRPRLCRRAPGRAGAGPGSEPLHPLVAAHACPERGLLRQLRCTANYSGTLHAMFGRLSRPESRGAIGARHECRSGHNPGPAPMKQQKLGCGRSGAALALDRCPGAALAAQPDPNRVW